MSIWFSVLLKTNNKCYYPNIPIVLDFSCPVFDTDDSLASKFGILFPSYICFTLLRAPADYTGKEITTSASLFKEMQKLMFVNSGGDTVILATFIYPGKGRKFTV